MVESVVVKNKTLDIAININKSTGEYWLDNVDFGQVQGEHHTFKFINQIGETIYNTSIGTRAISINGWVAGWNEATVSTLKKKLNTLINPQHEFDIIANKKRLSFLPSTSVVYSPTYQENNEVICRFLISGFCPYPLFMDEIDRAVSVAYTAKKFHFPLIIPKDKGIVMGVRQPSLIAEVNNTGDVPIGYTIEFRAFGVVKNPILIDIGSQQHIEINKTMAAGEIITVDTREGYRQVRGTTRAGESNYFKYRTLDSDWLTLQRGINRLRYNAEEGITALEVYIKFSPAYLEVNE